MNEVKTLDSDSMLTCQGCREDIAADESKVILGIKLYEHQRFLVFHEVCWRARWAFLDRFINYERS